MEKIEIFKTTVFGRNEKDFLITEVDGESVMMHVTNGRYWGLNTTTTDIWKFLENPKSLKEVVDHLMVIYDVKEDQCHAQAGSVMVGLLKNKILFIHENPENNK